MSHTPLISIIIPVYNAAEYLQVCVNSILSQTYDSMEVLLVNDGSTDNSLEICNLIAQQENKVKVKVIDQPNAGPNAARNRGLENAQGEFVVFVDADDAFYSSDTLSLNMQFFENNPEMDIVSFPQYRESSRKEDGLIKKSEQFIPRLLSDKLTILTTWYNGKLIDGHFPGKIFRKSLFNNFKLVEFIRFTEDHYEIPNICRRCGQVMISGVGGYVYKFNPNSAIHSEYTPEKRRGQLYSENMIYKYLCELKAPRKYRSEFYNRIIENAFYLSMTNYREEVFEILHRIPRCMQLGKPLINFLNLFTCLFGFNRGLGISSKMVKIIKYSKKKNA